MTSFTCFVRFQRRTLANLVGSMWKSDNDNDHAMLIALGIKSFISPFYRELKKNDIFTICWLFYFFFRQCIFYKFTLIKWMKRIQRFSGIICLTSFHEKNTIHCFFTLFCRGLITFFSWHSILSVTSWLHVAGGKSVNDRRVDLTTYVCNKQLMGMNVLVL